MVWTWRKLRDAIDEIPADALDTDVVIDVAEMERTFTMENLTVNGSDSFITASE